MKKVVVTQPESLPMLPYSKLQDKNRNTLAAQLPLAHPWSMYLELTNRCNFKCKFCPESIDNYIEKVGGIRSLDFEQFRKVCADILELGKLKVLRFYMLGEPFLHKELPDMVAYAKENQVADRIEVTSNGSAITAKNAERIIRSGLDYLRISIYAMEPERHRSITQSEVPPELIMNNIRRLWQLRKEDSSDLPFIYIKMINPFDAREEQLFLETYQDFCDEIKIEPPMNWDNPDEADFLDNVYGDTIDREVFFKYRKEVCAFPFYTTVVHASGDVSVCGVDWDKKTVVGNIFKQSLKEIWNGEELHAFQRMHIERRKNENDACRNCTYLYTYPDNIDEITDFDILYQDK